MGRAGAQLPASVLFMCTMNAVRSPMASAILEYLTSGRVRTASAGIRRGISDPYAVAVMDEIGIDIADHQPQLLADISDQSFEMIVSLSPEAHHHAVELTRVMAASVHYWASLDVAQMENTASRMERLNLYRVLRTALFERVKAEFSISGGPTI